MAATNKNSETKKRSCYERLISPQKVILCFIWMIIGFAASLMMLIVEKVLFRRKKGLKSRAKEIVEDKMETFLDDLMLQRLLPDKQLFSLIHKVLDEKERKNMS